MKRIPLTDRLGLNEAEWRTLQRIVQGHQGLDDIFSWGRTQQPPILPADVVVQDEFSHDVIVPWAAHLYLVYDTT
jgi:hypothetical protein